MKVFSLARYAFGIAAGVALLAGCSANGTTPSMGGSSVAPQNAGGYHHPVQELNREIAKTNPMGKGLPASRHPLAKSWHHASPAGTTGTLWATDSEYGSVDQIAYPSGTLVGQTSGFEYPYGDCSDKSGNIYVADFDLETLYELNSSGSVINSFPTGGEAFGCSVAPNGDVAVTNFDPGDVVIVAGPDAGQNWGGEALDWPGGFDLQGNFYVECADESPCSTPTLYEWPHGGSSWEHLNFSHSIGFPGGIQEDGKLLGVMDQNGGDFQNGIYLTKVSGSTATEEQAYIFSGNCSGSYIDDPSSWGSLDKKPDGVSKKKLKGYVLVNLDCFPSPLEIYGKHAGSVTGSITPVAEEYDHGVTLTHP
ncbi:MAG TPA: hypothetical protein VKR05_01200 [Candidatus Cybelea sp.]|nr:hypothetical protein [Candidatus Cybelea sp.]